MDRVLILTSVASMLDQFNRANLAALRELGAEVHVAANFRSGNTSTTERVREYTRELDDSGVRHHQIDFARNAWNLPVNLRAYRQVATLLRAHDFRFLHCQSPIGGVVGRLAARRARTPAVYTAHGFHFFAGAPRWYWWSYYPLERWLAGCTDVLITINQEDHRIAQSFAAGAAVRLPGIGVDTAAFRPDADMRRHARDGLGLADDAVVLLTIGELNRNKNHAATLAALARLAADRVVLLICGKGDRECELRAAAQALNLGASVRFLGFRNDIRRILAAADVFVFPSRREGLPVSVMEAMAAGLPVVCSRIRGNVDLIEDGGGGLLFALGDIDGFASCIARLVRDPELRRAMSAHNVAAARNYDRQIVQHALVDLYRGMLSAVRARRN